MNICVVCGTDNNLNTQLTIVINNENIVVNLCDEHAEDTTIKTAREKYLERRHQIDLLVEQAKKLGLDPSSLLGVQRSSCGTSTPKDNKPAEVPEVSSKPKADSQQAKGGIETTKPKTKEDEGWISTAKYETIESRGYTSVGGQGAASYSSYKVSGQADTLDESIRQGKIRMGIAEGRGGSPIPVPLERVDGTGTTRIRIVNVEDDKSLQKRFKGMANNQEHQPDFRQGYNDATRPCPICRGECTVNGKDCPKCKGSGLISVF